MSMRMRRGTKLAPAIALIAAWGPKMRNDRVRGSERSATRGKAALATAHSAPARPMEV